MSDHSAPRLDAEALAFFAAKGLDGERPVPQAGPANGVKVRRIVQLTQDLIPEWRSCRILDLGCGDGVYAIEAGLHGAEVVALDGRTARMARGEAIAQRLGLHRVRFEQGDLRTVTAATHGYFDAVYALGILYHLDALETIQVLTQLRALTTRALLIDTHVELTPDTAISHGGQTYPGRQHREHDPADPEAVRQGRVLMSLDTARSYWFTPEALVRLLGAVGFTSVMEVHGPAEPGKPVDRRTFVALPGASVRVATYPWINGLSEEMVAAAVAGPTAAQGPPSRRWLNPRRLLRGILRRARRWNRIR